MPQSLPWAVPSSVTGIVEWPVRSRSSTTSERVLSGVSVESETTKPALYDLTSRTIPASSSTDWEP